MISVLHVKTKKTPAQQTAKLCAVWSHGRLHEIKAIVFVWLFQLLNTKRIKADPGKGERKLTVLNVGTVVLLALEFTCRESEGTLFAMVFLTTTFLGFQREV
jgi:hypothetical protein